jgi:hypothetical protein
MSGIGSLSRISQNIGIIRMRMTRVQIRRLCIAMVVMSIWRPCLRGKKMIRRKRSTRRKKTRGLMPRFVEITSEEAGFASGGEGVVKRNDVALQV